MMTKEMQVPQDMPTEIRDIMNSARQNVATQVNNELIGRMLWWIGRRPGGTKNLISLWTKAMGSTAEKRIRERPSQELKKEER